MRSAAQSSLPHSAKYSSARAGLATSLISAKAQSTFTSFSGFFIDHKAEALAIGSALLPERNAINHGATYIDGSTSKA